MGVPMGVGVVREEQIVSGLVVGEDELEVSALEVARELHGLVGCSILSDELSVVADWERLEVELEALVEASHV